MRRMYSENQLLKAIEKESAENGLKVFENIVDKDSHPRFIEGNIEITTITGVSKTFGKWSLSGSHLLIVLGISVENAVELGSNQTLAYVNVPEWIFNKIKPLFASVIATQEKLLFYADNFTTQEGSFNVRLGDIGHEKELVIRNGAILTLTANRNARIVIDYLIDNE